MATPAEIATVYARVPDPATAAAALEAAESCARYVDERFGMRDPLPQAKVVLAVCTGPGYTRKNDIVLSEVNADDRQPQVPLSRARRLLDPVGGGVEQDELDVSYVMRYRIHQSSSTFRPGT